MFYLQLVLIMPMQVLIILFLLLKHKMVCFFLYQQKTTKKLQNVLEKDLKESKCWNEYETKSENKNKT